MRFGRFLAYHIHPKLARDVCVRRGRFVQWGESHLELHEHVQLPPCPIPKENTLLTYGVLACLKGMAEQGCNGPVREAIDKIEKSLNLRAHDQ